MSGEMRDLRCSEHGVVMKAGPLRTSGVEATWTWFCPICSRALYTDDVLGDVERQQGEPTFEEWQEAQRGAGVTVLGFPPIKLGDE